MSEARNVESGMESELDTTRRPKRRKTHRAKAAFDFAKACQGLDATSGDRVEAPLSAASGAGNLSPGGAIALVGGFDGRDYLKSVDVWDVGTDRWTPRVSALQDHAW